MMVGAAAIGIVPRMMMSAQSSEEIALGAIRMGRLGPTRIDRCDEIKSQVDWDQRLEEKRQHAKASRCGSEVQPAQFHRSSSSGHVEQL
jgi:hypothetical protein